MTITLPRRSLANSSALDLKGTTSSQGETRDYNSPAQALGKFTRVRLKTHHVSQGEIVTITLPRKPLENNAR